MTSTLNRFIKVKSELYKQQFIKSKKVGNMYKYYELSDFLPTIIHLLNDNKLCHYFYFKNNDTCSCGVIRIIDVENQDDFLEIESILCNMTNIKDPKDVGAMSTYLKRYTYLIAFDITEDCKMEQKIAKETTEKVSDIDLINKINRVLRDVGKQPRTSDQLIEHAKNTNITMQQVLDGLVKKYRKH